MSLFQISLDTANRFYAWGWRASIAGAVVTLIGVILLMWGTRVRDRAAEKREEVANAELKSLRSAAEWRRLTSQQRDILVSTLTGHRITVWVTWVGDNPESTDFALAINQALKDAGLTIKNFSGWGARTVGLGITNVPGPDHNVLVNAFNKAGLPLADALPGPVLTNELAIIVGTKPPPF
jgi:hypothetical protein